MKMTARVLLSAALLCAGAAGASAQGITIDTNDVKVLYAVGTATQIRSDTLTNSLNIGGTGASSWDYGTLLAHTRLNLRSIVPSTTPYFAADFPAATHALVDTAFTYSFYDNSSMHLGEVVLKGVGYNYMALSGGDLLDYGFKGTGDAWVNNGAASLPAKGQWTRSPAAVYYHLPLALGTTWTTTYKEILSGEATVFGGIKFPVGPDTTSHTITYTVDAYGPLKVPGGSTQDALRMHKVDRLTNKSGSSVRAGFVIFAKNGASVQFNVGDSSVVSGTTAVYSLQWTGVTPTSVRQVTNAPMAFSLAQNYPNPFNPSTTIRFALPERMTVSLRVYNLLGEEVAALVQETLNAGEHAVEFNASRLSSGMYLYKLEAGNLMQTRRMMLVK
jgi:hypothetical protein